MPDPQPNLAVLIDADNLSAKYAEPLFEHIARYGTANVRRAYGDWSSPKLAGWTKIFAESAIKPITQPAHSREKNSTDIALVIDAMDLLYTGRFDGFCIVSSDSDFTALAQRIREQGLPVYGFGERKTPGSLRNACTEFLYIDSFDGETDGGAAKKTDKKKGGGGTSREEGVARFKRSSGLLRAMRSAIADLCDDDGWASLGPVGSRVKNAHSEFVPGNFGYARLGDLLEATELFEVRRSGQHREVRDLKAGS